MFLGVKSVAQFLKLDLSDSTIQAIADASTLPAMKANPRADCSWVKSADGTDAQHLRKGGSGGWREHFTVHQNAVYDEIIEDRMIFSEWKFTFG